ncbi:stage VI sporulation protein D [Bacillus sp. AK128]
MTIENQSSIRFSVEESIWFERGQEVADLLSMSLDPEIIIQEHDQYISVRGGLILTGEYHADDSEGESTLQPGARTVQEVERNEEGLSLLRHKFPIDITIPKNRIQNLNDVYVTIESFDYELPQRGNLLLEAELSITGIYEDQERSEAAQQEAPPAPLLPVENVEEEVEDLVEEEVLDIPQPEELNLPEETPATPEVEEEELVQPLMRGSLYEDEEVDEVDQSEQEDAYTPFVVEAKRDPVAEAEEALEEAVEELNEEEQIPVLARKEGPQLEFKSRVDQPAKTAKSEEANGDESYSTRDENALYLTKIFAKDDESETTRLKMCIVQKDETLELIAERYEVQPQTLIRVNNLDRDHLAEGQILYIPVAVGSLK